jgi:uncharacterized protein
MPPADPFRPLTPAERNRLDRLLKRNGGNVPSFEALDGLLAALLSGPELVPPSEVISEMLQNARGRSPFSTLEEAQAMVDLLMRHWNTVARALIEQAPFQPALSAKTPRASAGRDWARGYQLGMQARPRSWKPLRQHPLHGDLVNSILALAGEPRAEPRLALAMEQTGLDRRESHLEALGYNVTEIHGVLQPQLHRAPAAPPPPKRTRKGRARPVDPMEAYPAERWEVGLIPIAGRIENDVRARPVAVVVATGEGRVEHLAVESHLPTDEAGVAAVVAREVANAILKIGPASLIWVRDPAIANALSHLPQLKGAPVEVHARLPVLDDVARSLAEEFGGPRGGQVAHSDTWMGWGLAAKTVSAMFAAAARYHRAKPWSDLADDAVLDLLWPNGDQWAASVLGAAGMQTGLALFLDPDDLEALLHGEFEEPGMEGMGGMSLSLVFAPQDDVDRRQRKEILSHHWEVAGPEAYPQLMVMNSPTGGISEPAAERVTQALDALARLAVERTTSRKPGKRRRQVTFTWSDAETGLTVRRGRRR